LHVVVIVVSYWSPITVLSKQDHPVYNIVYGAEFLQFPTQNILKIGSFFGYNDKKGN